MSPILLCMEIICTRCMKVPISSSVMFLSMSLSSTNQYSPTSPPQPTSLWAWLKRPEHPRRHSNASAVEGSGRVVGQTRAIPAHLSSWESFQICLTCKYTCLLYQHAASNAVAFQVTSTTTDIFKSLQLNYMVENASKYPLPLTSMHSHCKQLAWVTVTSNKHFFSCIHN